MKVQKINLSCFRIKSAVLLSRGNEPVYVRAGFSSPKKPCLAPRLPFVSLRSRGRMLSCLFTVRAPTPFRMRVCVFVQAIPHVVRTLICGDHLLFPGLQLTEACLSVCLQLLGLVAS